MNNEIKRIDIKDFREKGLLQEVNRQFFHPIGLALEVVIDKETNEERLGGVWDYRDDPEGMIFHSSTAPTKEKASYYFALFKDKAPMREQNLGWVIQPLEGTDD